MDFEDLIPEIRKDKDNAEKWLIFIDDEDQGGNLATRINHGEDISAVFVSSNTVKRKGLARLTYGMWHGLAGTASRSVHLRYSRLRPVDAGEAGWYPAASGYRTG